MRDAPGGPYQLQAAIAAVHDEAATTDGHGLARRSRRCTRSSAEIAPSPVVELNRAVAVAMADGPEAGLAIVDALAAAGQLDDYPYLHSTRADLLRRLGRRPRRPRPIAARSR